MKGEPRNISDLSDEEMRAISRENGGNAHIIRSIYKKAISRMDREIARMDAVFTDFTQRGAALMTTAGLLSLLPFTVVALDANAFKHFFLWVFPFLFVGIFSYFGSETRTHIRLTHFPSIAEGTEDELLSLRLESTALQEVWKAQNQLYKRILKMQRLMSTSMLLYTVAFLIHFGLFLFAGPPDIFQSSVITISLLVLGFNGIYRNIKRSGTKDFSLFRVNIGVGAPANGKDG